MPARNHEHNEYEYEHNEQVDHYCYPNTSVLINKFDIRNYDDLNASERNLTALNILEAEEKPIKGNVDLKHLQNIHKFVFGYENDYNIALVQKLLQHSTAAVTQNYIGIQPQQIENALKKHNYWK